MNNFYKLLPFITKTLFMATLQRVVYHPLQTGRGFIKDVQAQIIFASLRKTVPLYQVPDDPYALEFYATDEEREIIQLRIDMFLQHIMETSRLYAMRYLLTKGMYLCRPAPKLQHALTLKIA